MIPCSSAQPHDAVEHCVECDDDFCASVAAMHRRLKSTASHQLVAISGDTIGSRGSGIGPGLLSPAAGVARRTLMCAQHQVRSICICYVCLIPISCVCQLCLLSFQMSLFPGFCYFQSILQEPLKLHDTQCGHPICVVCVSTEHSGHACVSLSVCFAEQHADGAKL